MKICRFNTNRLGVVSGRNVRDVSEAVHLLKGDEWPPYPGDVLIRNLDKVIPEVHRVQKNANILSLRDLHLNSPVTTPTKIIGTPFNYKSHMDEMSSDPDVSQSQILDTVETYGLFLKAPIPVGPDDGVRLGFANRRTDHEVELAIVIGKPCKKVSENVSLDYVAGYTIGLDMSIRGSEARSLRKSADSYSVVGPWLVTKDEIEDPDNLDISLSISGKIRQNSNTSEMIFSTRKIISYASSFYTLYPGDVIMAGTPEGVGPVSPGDVLDCTIEKIGTMQVPIRRAM